MSTTDDYREALLKRKVDEIRRLRKLSTEVIDRRHIGSNSYGSVEHIQERLFFELQIVREIVDAAISIEQLCHTIGEPSSKVRITKICEKSLDEVAHQNYGLISEADDSSPEANAYFSTLDLLRTHFKIYAEDKAIERARDHSLINLLALSPRLPQYALEEWQSATMRLTLGNARGAITSGKTLIETICKHVLDERKESYDSNDKLPNLYKKARKVFSSYVGNPETVKAFQQIENGLEQIVHGVSLLRNRRSDSHGRSPYDDDPDASDARAVLLAVASFVELLWKAHVNERGSSVRLDERVVQEVEAILADPPYTSWPLEKGRSAAEAWVALGFSAPEVGEWIVTDCGSPSIAKQLRDNGFTPEDAGLRSRVDDMRTIAELVRLGDLSIFDAQVLRDRIRQAEGI